MSEPLRWSPAGGRVRVGHGAWRRLLRGLEQVAQRTGRAPKLAPHLETGRAGELIAYWFLRDHGYTIVARNYRLPGQPGELDLIAWDGPTLVFIEVKTRARAGEIPAELAVDADKRAHLIRLARAYRRRRGINARFRYDVVVVLEPEARRPQVTLHPDVFYE